MGITRRSVLSTTAAGLGAAVAGGGLTRSLIAAPRSKSGPATSTQPAFDQTPYDWHDLRSLGLEGQGFSDVESPYDRLPARAKGVVRPPVWNLSHDSTGFSVDFSANTTAIAIRYELTSPTLAIPNMPAIGVSGIDCYAQLDDGGWRWLAVTKPTTQSIATVLIGDLLPVARRYRLYLPLYNGVKSAAIGLPTGVAMQRHAPRKTGTIAYYGTSISQGGCASRPGMAFTSILSRRLDRPFINLSFSGNGTMDASMGRFLVELDPACFVIDCVGNMQAPQVAERTRPLIAQLRAARAKTPILLVEERTPGSAWAVPSLRQLFDARQHALKAAYEDLRPQDANLFYLRGDDLIGNDGEAMIDGSHPSDLGMVRFADALEPVLRKILG